METVMIQQEYCNTPLWQPVPGDWINLKFIDLITEEEIDYLIVKEIEEL